MFSPPHTRQRLTFVRASESVSGVGEVVPDFDTAPAATVTRDCDVQPNPHARLEIPELAETYESTYDVKVGFVPDVEARPDIKPKDRTVLDGKQAEVVSSNDWPSHINLLVGTMPVH